MAVTPDEYELYSADGDTPFNPKGYTLTMQLSVAEALNAFKKKYGIPNYSSEAARNAATPGGSTPTEDWLFCRVGSALYASYGGRWVEVAPPGPNGVKIERVGTQAIPNGTAIIARGNWNILAQHGNGWSVTLDDTELNYPLTITRSGIWSINIMVTLTGVNLASATTARRLLAIVNDNGIAVDNQRITLINEDRGSISYTGYVPAGISFGVYFLASNITSATPLLNQVRLEAWQVG